MSRRRNRHKFRKGRGDRKDTPGARVSPISPMAGATGRTSGQRQPPNRERQLPMGTDSRAPAGPANRRGGRDQVSTPPQSSRSGRLPPDNSQPALRHNPAGGGTAPPYPGDPSWDQGGSQYRNQRPRMPPNDIRDVDIDSNWFTPMQPVWPFGPPFVTYPREWDYPVGINLEYISKRQQLYAQLRLMSRSWGILRTVLETRIDQMMRIPWEFQLRDQPEKKDKRIDELKAFFKRPDGKQSYDQWTRRLLTDLFVIDAPCIYRGWRRRDGKPYVLEVIDGAMIKPLIDDAGRAPDYPSPAYQQVTKGLPMVNFDETELIYAPMRPQPDLPIYGYSPVEQIYMELTQGIRRLLYQVNFWNEGTIPDVWANTPEDWTPGQVAQFQALHDALYGGNMAMKSKVRFMPGGVSPTAVKGSAGELLKSEYDEWLARIVCFAFSISPQPFVKEMNRATAETAQAQAESEGLHPLMTWFKNCVMDRIIEEDFGYDDIEQVWLPEKEVDEGKQADTLTKYVKGGIMKVNEARTKIGLPPVPEGNTLIIETASGGVPLTHAIEPPPDPVAPAIAPKPGGAVPKPGATPKQSKDPAQKLLKKKPLHRSEHWGAY
jgi:Phage portal protein